ncbi:MAG: polysaccharide biosynthesis C-terminal domain-containing protein, partial [Erysipelotrichaceae bacterium]|nr:polysaccharide biosynthesis C-terminal domain-containing protein [Erysipelotrichaceae bacterium]
VSDSLLKAIDTLIVVIMPVMVMCLICGDYIVTILFGRGNFGQAAVIATAGVVTGYALGFIFQAFRATCVRVYFAFKDSKTPMLNGLISVSANILLSLTLSRFMGVKGIAVATSIAMLLSSVLLLQGIDRYLPDFTLKPLSLDCIKVVFITLIVAVSSFYLKQWLPFGTYISFVIMGFYVVIVYYLLTLMTRVKPTVELTNVVYRTLKARYINH